MRKIKKLLTILGYLLFCGGYGYVILANFLDSTPADCTGKTIAFLISTGLFALYLPIFMCWESSYISHLEKEVDRLEKLVSGKTSDKDSRK